MNGNYCNSSGNLCYAEFTTEGLPVIIGDVNDDGKVTLVDVSMLFRYITHQLPEGSLTDKGLANGDANGDGKLTLVDVAMCYRLVAAT